MEIPACPRCQDGGSVALIEVRVADGNVFNPPPGDLAETVVVFRCQCGWMKIAPKSHPSPPADPATERRGS